MTRSEKSPPVHPVAGQCLICAGETALMPGGALGEHPNPDTHAVCIGTGFPRVLGDGRDDIRRTAIAKHAELTAAIRTHRDDIAESVAGTYSMRHVGTSAQFGGVIRAEITAHVWHALGVHGQWHEAVREAVVGIAGRSNSTDAMERAVRELEAAGYRDWLKAAQWYVQPLSDGAGPLGQALATIIFDV